MESHTDRQEYYYIKEFETSTADCMLHLSQGFKNDDAQSRSNVRPQLAALGSASGIRGGQSVSSCPSITIASVSHRSNYSISMSKPVVLITSATSRNGSEAAKLLLAQDKCTVRLAARDPSKLTELVAKGGDAIALDPMSSESMTQACTGVDFVYLILPTLVNDAEIAMFHNFLHAAKTTGTIKHVVYLSGVDAVSPAVLGAEFKPIHHHYEHEQQLRRSGIPFTSLRPAWFHENQVMYHSDAIKHTGEFRTSAGDGVWTSVAIADIAAAAVAVLSNPGPHAGKIYTLTTEAVTEKMIAEKISKVTGQTVRHVNLTPEEHGEMLVKIFGAGYGGTGRAAQERAAGIVTLDEEKRRSLFGEVHPDLELLIGRKGVSLDDFLGEHAAAFKQAAA